MSLTLGELAVRFGCGCGDPDAVVDSVRRSGLPGRATSPSSRTPSTPRSSRTRARGSHRDAKSAGQLAVRRWSSRIHRVYARIATLLHPDAPLKPGVHPLAAVIFRSRRSDPSAATGDVGEGVRIGARCIVPQRHRTRRRGRRRRAVGGARVHRAPRATRCALRHQPGAVVGGAASGFAPEKRRRIKVPQIGSVGGHGRQMRNTTIDRGAGRHGHRRRREARQPHHDRPQHRIGAHPRWPHVAIAGSSVVGKRCILGGRAGPPATSPCATTWWSGHVVHFHNITKPGCILPRCRARKPARGGESSRASSVSTSWRSACAPWRNTWASRRRVPILPRTS